MLDKEILRLLLWVVLINGGLVLLLMWLRGLRGRVGYSLVLLALCGAAGIIMALGREQGLLAHIVIGAFVFLVIVPLILHGLTLSALRRGRLETAIRLTSIRELLQPGLGVRREREFLQSVREMQGAQATGLLEALQAHAESETDPAIRQRLQEQVLLGLLRQQRFADALEFAERAISRESAAERPRLGMLLVSVHGELGNADAVVDLMLALEDGPGATDPSLSEEMDATRAKALAFTGQAAALERLMRPASAFCSNRPPAWRSFWLGVAWARAGDGAAATAALGDARQAAHRRPDLQAMIDEHLGRVATGTEPVEVTDADALTRLTRRIERRAQLAGEMPRMRGAGWRLTPVTLLLTAINLGVFLALYALGDGSKDTPTLIRAGANYDAAVAAGEYWRLASAMFLHWGAIHLVVNVLMLWFLGRFAEQMLGSAAFLVVYFLAGVSGNALSYALTEGGVSVGASSSLSGVLGAALVVLLFARGKLPEAWRRSMVLLFTLFIGVSFLPGLDMKQIDNAAHLGGLVGGTAVAALLRLAALERVRQTLLIALVLACLALSALTVQGLVTSDLRRLPWAGGTYRGLAFQHPVNWRAVHTKNQLVLTDLLSDDTARVFWLGPTSDLGLVVQAAAEHQRARLKKQGLQLTTGLESQGERDLAVGWRGFRLRFKRPDGSAGVELHAFTSLPRGQERWSLRVLFQTTQRRLGQIQPMMRRFLRSVRAHE